MTSLFAALAALPELIKLLISIGTFLKDALGDNPQKFIVDAHETFEKLKNAKTPEEKQASARAIADLIKRL
jgi:hypothetical protein